MPESVTTATSHYSAKQFSTWAILESIGALEHNLTPPGPSFAMNELLYAVRRLLKAPGFTSVAVLTLALGIGANTVVFSVVSAVWFRTPDFPSASRLMWLKLGNTQTGEVSDRYSWRDMQDVRESVKSFELVGTFGSGSQLWRREDRAELTPTLSITPVLVTALEMRPALGRTIQAGDVAPNAELVALISHEVWQTEFAGSPEVLGQQVRLDGKLRTLIGVLPPGLRFPPERAPAQRTGSSLHTGLHAFWLPFPAPSGEDLTSRNSRMFLPIARLKPGATEADARTELSWLSHQLAADHPDSNRNRELRLVSFRDQVLGRSRQGIPLLAAAVGAVLIVCCVNLANLLLARGAHRQRELAVRSALGAGRRGLFRVLAAECVILSTLGGGLGILLAQGGLRAILLAGAASVPYLAEARLNGAALAFTFGLSMVTAALFGLLPALRLSRIAPIAALSAGSRATAGPRIRSWQLALLAGQIAVVLVLLTASGFLLESFRRLINEDLGYQPRSVVTMDLESWGFETNGELCRYYRSLRERLRSLPGVDAVGTVSSAPLTAKWNFQEKAQLAGESVPEADRPTISVSFIAFDYFAAMGIPLKEGRLFADAELNDDGYGQRVVINEAAARRLFPNRPAIGGRFTVGSNPNRMLEVIGVVKDTREMGLDAQPTPHLYWQYAFGGAQVVVRSGQPAAALMPALRNIVRQMDPRVTIQAIRPFADIVADTVAERRFFMLILTAYAVLSLIMAAVGIVGTVAYQVSQRTNEFGVRLALGAMPLDLLRLVLIQVLRVTLVGVAAGVGIWLVSGRLLSSQFYQLTPDNPWMLSGASLLILCSALAASAWPARQAARVDPVEALRSE